MTRSVACLLRVPAVVACTRTRDILSTSAVELASAAVGRVRPGPMRAWPGPVRRPGPACPAGGLGPGPAPARRRHGPGRPGPTPARHAASVPAPPGPAQ